MRVALIVTRFPAASETFVASVFERLVQRGWDAHVVCADSPEQDWALFGDLAGLRDRVHPGWPQRPRWLAAMLIPLAVLRCAVRAPARTQRYLSRGWKLFGPGVVKKLFVDAELIVLGPALVHYQFGVFAKGREHLGELLDCKVIVSFQGGDINYVGLEQPGYYDEVFEAADSIHFLGDDLRRRAIRRGYVPDGTDEIIMPGVDASRFAPEPRQRLEGRPFRILSVGRLHWKKGYEYALHAVKLLSDAGVACEYRVVGDGSYRDAIDAAVEQLGIGHLVTFLGPQSLDRVREEMQWADVLLHAAVSEGFCYVAVEAQAMELPVVTSDADGLPENVADGETGFVVGRRDPAALAARLVELAADDDLRRRLGAAGRHRVLDVFAPKRQIEAFEELYRTTASRT
jgi:colanic acid/amylovoran biosynthesis glycosyltransferase